MSLLYKQIKSDITSSMKDGNKNTTQTLRLLVDLIQKSLMAKKIDVADITDGLVIDCVNAAIKQRRESVAEFDRGNRPDLSSKELAEIEILKAYQPEQMSEAELTQKIQEFLVGKSGPYGLIIKEVMQAFRGKADGKLINEIVKKAGL